MIDSDNQYFNGVMVNDTDFTVKNLTMTADGSGGNDFKGFGAGVAGYGKTMLDVDGFVFEGGCAVRVRLFFCAKSEDWVQKCRF